MSDDDFHPDYTPIPPSPRERVAMTVPDLLREAGVFPAEPTRSADHKYWCCAFTDVENSSWRLGEVRVYNPEYLMVLDRNVQGENWKFATLENLFEFIQLWFVKKDWDSARAVKQRESKRKAPSGSDLPGCGPSRELPIAENMFGEGNVERIDPKAARMVLGEAWMMCGECNGKLFSFDGETDGVRPCPYKGKDGKCNPR